MIDELDRVRQFRSGKPLPTNEAYEAARIALERSISRSPQAGASTARPKRPSPRPRRRRAWLIRGAVAACAAIVALVTIGVPGNGGPAGPTPAVAAAFNQLANIAASGPRLAPGPGQFLYTDSRNDYSSQAIGRGGTCVTTAVQHRQLWIAANGSGLLRESSGPPRFTSAADHSACLRIVGRSQLAPSSSPSNLWFAARCFQLGPTNNMQALSTDPRVLLRQMRRIDGGPRTPAEDFVHVGDFLRETDASPALRAALYRAAALIPGVRLLGTVKDHLGRAGLGVAFDSHGARHELIFDRRTAALMGEQDGAVGGLPADWAVYLQSRLVRRLPQPAPAPLTPPCINSGGYDHQTPSGSVMTGQPVSPGN
jgi:hypothetical protein